MHSTSQQKQQMDAISHLTAQVLAAEEAINVREDRISKLQQELREKEETVAVLQAQVSGGACILLSCNCCRFVVVFPSKLTLM